MAEEAGPEMAVVDMQLQGIDGLEVLKRLREASPGTEVIMATATAHASTSPWIWRRCGSSWTRPSPTCVSVASSLI